MILVILVVPVVLVVAVVMVLVVVVAAGILWSVCVWSRIPHRRILVEGSYKFVYIRMKHFSLRIRHARELPRLSHVVTPTVRSRSSLRVILELSFFGAPLMFSSLLAGFAGLITRNTRTCKNNR